jgi:hypothetical protein
VHLHVKPDRGGQMSRDQSTARRTPDFSRNLERQPREKRKTKFASSGSNNGPPRPSDTTGQIAARPSSTTARREPSYSRSLEIRLRDSGKPMPNVAMSGSNIGPPRPTDTTGHLPVSRHDLEAVRRELEDQKQKIQVLEADKDQREREAERLRQQPELPATSTGHRDDPDDHSKPAPEPWPPLTHFMSTRTGKFARKLLRNSTGPLTPAPDTEDRSVKAIWQTVQAIVPSGVLLIFAAVSASPQYPAYSGWVLAAFVVLAMVVRAKVSADHDGTPAWPLVGLSGIIMALAGVAWAGFPGMEDHAGLRYGAEVALAISAIAVRAILKKKDLPADPSTEAGMQAVN